MELMEAIQASFDYPKQENLMGERRKDALRLDFDRKLKLEFKSSLLPKNGLEKGNS